MNSIKKSKRIYTICKSRKNIQFSWTLQWNFSISKFWTCLRDNLINPASGTHWLGLTFLLCANLGKFWLVSLDCQPTLLTNYFKIEFSAWKIVQRSFIHFYSARISHRDIFIYIVDSIVYFPSIKRWRNVQ